MKASRKFTLEAPPKTVYRLAKHDKTEHCLKHGENSVIGEYGQDGVVSLKKLNNAEKLKQKCTCNLNRNENGEILS